MLPNSSKGKYWYHFEELSIQSFVMFGDERVKEDCVKLLLERCLLGRQTKSFCSFWSDESAEKRFISLWATEPLLAQSVLNGSKTKFARLSLCTLGEVAF